MKRKFTVDLDQFDPAGKLSGSIKGTVVFHEGDDDPPEDDPPKDPPHPHSRKKGA